MNEQRLTHPVTETPAFAASMAAHEVLALRELRQRCIDEGVRDLAGVNVVLNQMMSERARFIGQGYPDLCGDVLEGASLERCAVQWAAAGVARHA